MSNGDVILRQQDEIQELRTEIERLRADNEKLEKFWRYHQVQQEKLEAEIERLRAEPSAEQVERICEAFWEPHNFWQTATELHRDLFRRRIKQALLRWNSLMGEP